MQKIKYITNKELLAEITKCKASFCSFTSAEYAIHDVIVDDPDKITPELLIEVIAQKAAKLSSKATPVAPDSIDPASIVFRVMADSHLPPADEKKRRLNKDGDLIKANFNPFRHFILRGNDLIEVGRSHWRGDFATGSFSIDHGRISNRLATMFMLLVEQYSRRANWRNYCCDPLTEALTQRGWLNMEQINEDDMILSYNEGRLTWSKIKSIYRGEHHGKMHKLDVVGMDALVTPHHKFLTTSGLKEVEMLVEQDRLILTGAAEAGAAGDAYSDAFVELAGWMVREGSFYAPADRNYRRITIAQNEGEKADRIRKCLRELDVCFSECHRLNYTGNTLVNFNLTKDICLRLEAIAPDRVLTMPFILALSEAQRELLINTMIDGDGFRTKPCGESNQGDARYAQKDKAHLDAFLALCTLNGYRTATHLNESVSFGKATTTNVVDIFSKNYNRHMHSTVEDIDFHGGKRHGRALPGQDKQSHPNEPMVDYSGPIWCPETEFGTFIARRNGTVYLSGNSYLDEMRSNAVLQLTQVGLQFDESRSDNPFAFYTQITKNVFRRVLNIEKRCHEMRDDLLLMAGAMPSFNRQVDNEIEQRDDHGEKPAKRGRKPKNQSAV
jgi:hypothetical protein